MQEQQASSTSMVKFARAWHTGVNNERVMVSAQVHVRGRPGSGKHVVSAISLAYVVDHVRHSGSRTFRLIDIW
jgi:hypothetical protein